MNETPEATVQLPRALSTLAGPLDESYYFIFWVSVVFFVAIVGTMCWFVYKYRRRPGVRAEETKEHTALEIFWTFSPLLLLVVLFKWGWDGFLQTVVAPANAEEIRIYARQWDWTFDHPTDACTVSEDNELTIPVGVPIRMVMTSSDVIHSFYVPEFRVKRDLVPGMYSTLWFEATHTTAELDPEDPPLIVYCTEYCGAPAPTAEAPNTRGHFGMRARVTVVTREEYDRFLAQKCSEMEPSLDLGEQLYTRKGCVGCHSTDGTTRTNAPNWRNLFGSRERIRDVGEITVDENYLRESMLMPTAKVVEGYNPVMPQVRLQPYEVESLIMYIKSLSEEGNQ